MPRDMGVLREGSYRDTDALPAGCRDILKFRKHSLIA
jgi:hypothetical protein